MKKTFTFLSQLFILLVLVSCSDDQDNSVLSNKPEIPFSEVNSQIISLADEIQQSEREYINIHSIRPALFELNEMGIVTSDSTNFIVELIISEEIATNNDLIQNLENKYHKPLISNQLTSWYIHTKSGKELEISIIEEEKRFFLRFLLRTYL